MTAHRGTSHNKRCLATKQDLRGAHAADRNKGLREDEIQRVKNYFILYVEELAKESSGLIRRRAVSTATVYFRRFYLNNTFLEYDPCCVAPACLYLACKAEESQVQAKLLYHLQTKLQQNGRYPLIAPMDIKQTLDLELALLEGLNFDLVVQSPAVFMMQSLGAAHLDGLGKVAWAVMNDSYLTEACLLYQSCTTAAACIAVAGAFSDQDVSTCLGSLPQAVAMDEAFDVVGLLLRFYQQQREPVSHEACFRYLAMLK